MSRIYVCNAFSPNMLLGLDGANVVFTPLTLDEAKSLLKQYDEVVSAVGHGATATILSKLLGMEIPFNRTTLRLGYGDEMVVAVLSFRPEEGKVYSLEEMKRFVEEGKLKFFHVKVEKVENRVAV